MVEEYQPERYCNDSSANLGLEHRVAGKMKMSRIERVRGLVFPSPSNLRPSVDGSVESGLNTDLGGALGRCPALRVALTLVCLSFAAGCSNSTSSSVSPVGERHAPSFQSARTRVSADSPTSTMPIGAVAKSAMTPSRSGISDSGGQVVGAKGSNSVGGSHDLSVAAPSSRSKKDSPGLRSNLTSRAALVRVSSIMVSRPTYGSGAREALAQRDGIARSLMEALTQELDLDVKSVEDAPDSLSGKAGAEKLNSTSLDNSLGLGATGPAPSLPTLLSNARNANLDSVLVTTISDYQVRDGSRAGASSLAVVVFSMELVGVDGTPIWNANFSFRDQALSENLFKLGQGLFQSNEGVPVSRGVGFKSEKELILAGFREAARALASERNALFFPSA